MTAAQRDAIINPAQGLIIYCLNCTSRGELQIYNGATWVKLSTSTVSAPVYAPVLTTDSVRKITPDMAKIYATPNNSGTIPYTAFGFCWSKTPNPTVELSSKTNYGSGGAFSSPFTYSMDISGLDDSSLYYVRGYMTNDYTTGYGNQLTFTTLKGIPPTITTLPISSLGSWSANSGLRVQNAGNASINNVGVCWSKFPNPTVSLASRTTQSLTSGIDSVKSFFNGLEPSTTYYVRAYATTSSIGTSYGNQISFTTLPTEGGLATCGAPRLHNDAVTYGSMTDIDGNVYKTVLIRGKEWMAENLKVSRYNDGTAITSVTNASSAWSGNDSVLYACPFGRTYNFYAVSSGKLCPSGWSMPYEEYSSIDSSYGGLAASGGKMKSADTTLYWQGPNTGADNASGFSALPNISTGSRIFGDYWTIKWNQSCGWGVPCTYYYHYRRLFWDSSSSSNYTTSNPYEQKPVRCYRNR